MFLFFLSVFLFLVNENMSRSYIVYLLLGSLFIFFICLSTKIVQKPITEKNKWCKCKGSKTSLAPTFPYIMFCMTWASKYNSWIGQNNHLCAMLKHLNKSKYTINEGASKDKPRYEWFFAFKILPEDRNKQKLSVRTINDSHKDMTP